MGRFSLVEYCFQTYLDRFVRVDVASNSKHAALAGAQSQRGRPGGCNRISLFGYLDVLGLVAIGRALRHDDRR